MKNEWPTKDNDMTAAKSIIDKYIDFNEGEPLGLLEIHIGEGESVKFKTPDWVSELANYFSKKYGPNLGGEVTNKVLTRCLLKGKTIH